MMDIEKLIESVRLCGSTPKVDQCKQCAYWSGGDMSKCIPRMTTDAATALSTLQIENRALRNSANGFKAENEKLRAGLNDLRTQWDMYGGDEGITSTFAELEQARAEITRLKHYEDKCHDCPIVCAKREIIKAHEELEAIQAELEQVKRENSRLKEILHGMEKN